MQAKRWVVRGAMVVAVGVAAWVVAQEQEAGVTQLPPPELDRGRPLMEVLKDRQSLRSYSARPPPPQELANLLWAAWGVNRPRSGKRTAPSAVNWQEIDVYVAMADGLYLYDATAHALNPVLADDVRDAPGAPVNLFYVADFARMGRAAQGDKVFYSAADTGFISQNVYLYCASEGLATVVRGSINRPALAAKMGLRADQKIILAQSVGYPK